MLLATVCLAVVSCSGDDGLASDSPGEAAAVTVSEEVRATAADAVPLMLPSTDEVDSSQPWTSAGLVTVSDSGCIVLGQLGTVATMVAFPSGGEDPFASIGGLEAVVGRRVQVRGPWWEAVDEIDAQLLNAEADSNDACAEVGVNRLQLVLESELVTD